MEKAAGYRRTIGDRIFDGINYLLLSILGFTTLYPFIYALVLSFNDGNDALKGGIYFWPRKFTLDNYYKAFQNPNISSAFQISIARTVLSVVLSVFLTAMLAYALSKKGMPGRKYFVMFFYFTMLFGAGLIPKYVIYRKMNLLNNFWIYVLPGLYNFYNAIVMKTYFDGIPDSLSEAAEIDGCSELQTFFRIILPLSMPVLATISLFVGVGSWNDWFTGEYFINKPELVSAATLLNKLLSEASFESSAGANGFENINESIRQNSNVTPEALRMTFLIILTVPILCIYPFLQKYFVKGVMIGSIKE